MYSVAKELQSTELYEWEGYNAACKKIRTSCYFETWTISSAVISYVQDAPRASWCIIVGSSPWARLTTGW